MKSAKEHKVAANQRQQRKELYIEREKFQEQAS
jgi:hypothetical protein